MDQAENYLYPVLDKILIKLKENKDTILKNDKNYENIKAKVIQQLKNENENKLIKTIISYGLRKANLDNIDFSNENISFIEIIKTKTIQALKNVSKPSRKNIFILLLIQWIILLLIWIIPY